MMKKFLPLTSDKSPSQNPYEVRTYAGDSNKPDWKIDKPCTVQRRCHPNSTISKVLTLEDQIRILNQKAHETRFLRPYRKKCSYYDDYTVCIATQRTPEELKTHAVMRELYIKEKEQLDKTVDANRFTFNESDIIELPGPLNVNELDMGEDDFFEEGEEEQKRRPVKPQVQSPSCSVEEIFLLPQKVLDLKRPRSGYFHNETEPPEVPDDGVPYSRYDPRALEKDLELQALPKHDLIEGRTPDDLWTWNVGFQNREEVLDDTYLYSRIPYLDCHRWRLRVYNIPKDLDKTFTAVIVFGTSAVRLEPPPRKPPSYLRPKEMACIFVGYAESFHLNPDFWIPKTMNGILKRGEKLRKLSESLNYKSKEMEFDIINQVQERKAVLSLKHHFSGTIINEPNIYKVLTLFFYKFNAGVFVSKNLYLLIWKRCLNSFYVFDPNGRDELCQRDFEDGKCSLMDTQYVEHLVHLIVNCSDIESTDTFTLYEVYLKNFGKINEPMPKYEARIVRRVWAVVNNQYALIPSYKEGLSPPNSAVEHNASMVVSLIALIYAHIEFPMKWRMETIDDIIKFGLKFNRHLRLKYKLRKYNQQLNILDMPTAIMMVAYRCFMKKFPFMYSGHIAECTSFTESQLTKALKDLFMGATFDACLLQIDNSVLAVWRDSRIFYVFDPFRRGNAGQVLDPDDYRAIGAACLQMHTTLESLCRILYQKALQMRRGGKLFIHAYIIGCIRAKMDYSGKNKWPNLKLLPPKYTSEEPKEEEVKPPPKKGKPKKVPEIEHLKEEERIPEYDEDDVVDTVFADLVREIIDSFKEPIIKRPQIYKQAKKVLLRSDSEYLESLKYKLKHHQDYDQIYNKYQDYPDADRRFPTIEEELAMPTNYELLPDGTYIIFGSTDLPELKDETLSKLGGLLANLVTMALTAKYKIPTWNSRLIEYALDSVNSFSDDYKDYETSLMSLLSRKAPVLRIGEDIIEMKVVKITKSEVLKPLKEVLIGLLEQHKRLIVICQRFSCFIMKQLNFLYQFIGYPTNATGYRSYKAGPACMIRTLEMDTIIRRMEFACNPAGCEVTNYVVLAMKARIVNRPQFSRFPLEKQKRMYKEAYMEKKRLEQIKSAKMKYLDDTLKQEKKRIKDFYKEKERRRRRKERPAVYDADGNLIEEETMESDISEDEEEMGEELEEIEPKHKPGRKLKRLKLETPIPTPILYGYHMRVKDCLLKIQGSTAIEGRDQYSMDEIKACFFASVLAVLYAVQRPLHEWHTQRIDQVIQSALNIAQKVDDMEMAPQRIIKNITVDDYIFDVWVKSYNKTNVNPTTFMTALSRAVAANKYLLLFTGNTTYTIYRDEYIHLFDPYGSMVKLNGQGEEEGADEKPKKKHCPKCIKRYGERDTASWILFIDLKNAVEYINERISYPDWQTANEYRFFVVDIISYKKAPTNTRLLQLLTDLSVPPCCNSELKYGAGEEGICATAESMNWLELKNCLPDWSRLKRRNASGHYRNLPVSKIKKFDIEIDGRLWSVWGNLHPDAAVFEESSHGKSHFACYILGFCAATVYHLMDWSPNLMDTIVINGNRYHQESLKSIRRKDYEFRLEDLETECMLENIRFYVNIQFSAYGKLYAQPLHDQMNLAKALTYFFTLNRFGILTCGTRSLAFGFTPQHDGGYFMFDCQSKDHPLFPRGQGAAYLLRTRYLQVLLYCIIVTLDVHYYNVEFCIHKVEISTELAGGEENDEEEDEQE